MAGKRDKKGSGTIVIRKEEVVGGGHHGGAWKVAYADFVTAMMAFFLLMWLLNATTEEQRKGLADYFSPNSIMSRASSGTGQPFGGHTAFDEGAMVSDRGAVQINEGKQPPLDPIDNPDPNTYTAARQEATGTGDAPPADANASANQGVGGPEAGAQPSAQSLTAAQARGAAGQAGDRQPTLAEIQAEKQRQERVSFAKAADDIRAAVNGDPQLAELAKQLSIDMTPEGLRIQIMDEVKSPMFASGSADPNDRARELLKKIVPVLQKLSEGISIAGHTDAAPYAGVGKTNWELSSERANTARRLLTDSGLADSRIRSVTGHADHDPLLPADPLAAANRRIAIVVLRNVNPPPAGETGN
jgi:chemotaxis protein MotB